MERTFHLTVITPERLVLDEAVSALVAPGSMGSLGVLANHAPLITTLVPGRLSITAAHGARSTFMIGAGFLDVRHNEAILLTQSLTAA